MSRGVTSSRLSFLSSVIRRAESGRGGAPEGEGRAEATDERQGLAVGNAPIPRSIDASHVHTRYAQGGSELVTFSMLWFLNVQACGARGGVYMGARRARSRRPPPLSPTTLP